MRPFCLIGMTIAPWPVTMRNCVAPSLCLEPEMSSASSGAGTCQRSTSGLLFLWKRGDRHRARGPALDDDDAGVLGDGLVRVGGVGLGAATDRDHHLPGPGGRDRHADITDRPDERLLGLVIGHAPNRTAAHENSEGQSADFTNLPRADARAPPRGARRRR